MGGALGLLALGPWGTPAEPEAEAKDKGVGKGLYENGCRVQAPQKFLERRSFLVKGILDTRKHNEATRYFAEHYGHVEDDLTPKYNGEAARTQAKLIRFMGLPIQVHAKIAPAYACVEKRIAKTCAAPASRYTPKAIGGFRYANTYRGAEISNHLFGIAIDIDPDQNPCCGCVDPWPSSPICKKPGNAYQRTSLPKCWINAFERYGFDWLGHDTLEDTMHFEFLGNPERITK